MGIQSAKSRLKNEGQPDVLNKQRKNNRDSRAVNKKRLKRHLNQVHYGSYLDLEQTECF